MPLTIIIISYGWDIAPKKPLLPSVPSAEILLTVFSHIWCIVLVYLFLVMFNLKPAKPSWMRPVAWRYFPYSKLAYFRYFFNSYFCISFDQSSTTFFNKSAGLGQHQKVDTALEQEVWEVGMSRELLKSQQPLIWLVGRPAEARLMAAEEAPSSK